VVEQQTQAIDETKLPLKTTLSNIEDLDMAEGISKMQSNQTAYEIALKSYAQLQQMSLFNFLN
jgi:flagellar hook-associated protein 3 FlgL